MLEELLPGVSAVIALDVVCVVVLSEFLKKQLSKIVNKSGEPVLKGFWVLLPLLLSALVTVVTFLSKGITAVEIPQTIVTIFGYSIVYYEVIGKRLHFGEKHEQDKADTE